MILLANGSFQTEHESLTLRSFQGEVLCCNVDESNLGQHLRLNSLILEQRSRLEYELRLDLIMAREFITFVEHGMESEEPVGGSGLGNGQIHAG